MTSADAPAYKLSFEAGRRVDHAATAALADGMACRVPNEEALAAMLAGVERMVAVSEEEVAAAMRLAYTTTHNLAEGSGAAGLAAVMQEREAVRGKRVGIVLTGGNVDAAVFARVLTAG